MKKRKVWSSIALPVLLSAAILGGCGQSAEKPSQNVTATPENATASASATPTASASPQVLEPVTLKYYYYGASKPGDEAVFEAMNTLLKEKINANMEFYKIPNGDYTQKMIIMVNALEEFDLCFTSPDSLNYFENASKGAFTDITGLLPQYAPETYALFSPEIWEATKVDGKIYASINQQIFARQSGYSISKPLADKYAFDPSGVTKLADLTPFLEKVKAGEPADMTDQLFNASMKSHVFSYLYPSFQWETIGGTDVPGVSKTNEEKPQIFNEYATPEFKEHMLTLKDFQQKGLIAKDALTRPAFDTSKYAAAYIATVSPGVEQTLKNSYKHERYVIALGDPLLTTYGSIATMTGVSATSKNPERALMYIELMNTDKDLYNTLTWGIENEDYKKVSDNRVEVLPESKYGSSGSTGWMYGNQFNSFVTGTQSDDLWTKTKEVNDSAVISKIYGFTFNPENVKTEMTNCAAIVNEYKANFNTGMYGDNTESTLAEFLAKLETAGVSKIIAEKQSQLDAFLAQKK